MKFEDPPLVSSSNQLLQLLEEDSGCTCIPVVCSCRSEFESLVRQSCGSLQTGDYFSGKTCPKEKFAPEQISYCSSDVLIVKQS